MRYTIAVLLSLLAGLAAHAQAAPTINVGNHPNIPIAASALIDVYVTGLGPTPNSIGAIDLYVSIASEVFDGPAPVGEPKINSVDVVTGTIFAGNSAFAVPGQVLFASDQVWDIDNITNNGVLTNNGKLFTVDLNTLGVAPGSTWALKVLNVTPNYEGGPINSNYANDQVGDAIFLGTNGTFTIVPEPGSIALGLAAVAALGAIAMRRRISGKV